MTARDPAVRLHAGFQFRILCILFLAFPCALDGIAGVSRAIQEQYKRDYENKAMFLKVPIYSEKLLIHISGSTFRPVPGTGSPRFRVGDQLRILLVDFANDEIKFRMAGIATQGVAEVGFKFDGDLQDNFPNRDVFDQALKSTFTEGIKYTDIEDAKRAFLERQFDRSVREIADSAALNRESVLKNIAPQIPAYQEALREIETLKNRLQEVSGQLSQSQAENRRLEAESKSQIAELSRLKTANAALQQKIDVSALQVSRLDEELRDAKGTAQGYQREIASIQRSLNLRVDSSRDLGMQIAELGQVMRKLQKEHESQAGQIAAMRNDLDSQQAANARLLAENEELKSQNLKMKATIAALTSNKDSLARQYLDLKNAKDKLDDFSETVGALRTRIADEGTEGGVHSGKVHLYLKNVFLGSLIWRIPTYLNHSESKNGDVTFVAESIDQVRLTPVERRLLRTLGEKLKVRVDLSSESASMEVGSEKDTRPHELGERDRSTWRWTIRNRGAEDVRLTLTAYLINRNSDEISFFQHHYEVISSNAVRQVRNYLEPVPLAVGIVLGFLLFGVVGIFRRPKHRILRPKDPAAGSSAPAAYTEKKQL